MARKKSYIPKADSPQKLDDFRVIKGIGPVQADRLLEAGIHTFQQLASLTPAELANRIEGLSEKKIAKMDWEGQARKLASNKGVPGPLEKETGQPELHQHYENFTLEFLLDEKHAIRRTRLVHIQSGDADTWAGWEVESFLDFIARHAGVSVPVVKKSNQAASEGSSLISQFLTVDADTKEVEIPPSLTRPIVESTSVQIEREPVATVLKAPETDRLTGTLCLRNLDVLVAGSDSPVSFLQQDQPYAVRLQLDLAEVKAPGDLPLNFKATILAKQLGGPSHAVGEIASRLKFSKTLALNGNGVQLPPGAYRLEAFVELSLEASPGRLTADLKGNLLQVY